MSTHDVIDIEESPSAAPKGRPGDGATFLLLADESDEFKAAMRFAVRRSQVVRGHVCLLHVIDVEDFVHWGTVEAQMKQELRAQAEQFIWGMAGKIHELGGLYPSLYIREGNQAEAIIQVIDNDPEISALVLGASAASGGPGPLVSYFMGKGVTKLNVPLVVVPDHLEPEKIDDVACFAAR